MTRRVASGALAAIACAARARADTRPVGPPPGVRVTPADQQIAPSPAPPDSFEARTAMAVAPYRPRWSVAGPIRIWGHGARGLPWMTNLLNLWEAGFRRFQPGASIENHMFGTSSGVPSLFNGTGEIAILGEEILPPAALAFQRFKGYPPSQVQVVTGSLDVRNFDYAQQVFVHRDNPLNQISLVQLDGVLGADHRRGPRNLRTWGDLGLRGDWSERPVQPYSWAIDDSFGFYLQQAVLLGSHRWNCALREFRHITYSDGSIYDHGQQILDALARDRFGLAVSNIRYAGPQVKALPLAQTAAGPFVQASKPSLITRTYPLTRTLPAVFDRTPDGRMNLAAREFLRFVLSREGQSAVVEDGRYLPLSPAFAADQRSVLA